MTRIRRWNTMVIVIERQGTVPYRPDATKTCILKKQVFYRQRSIGLNRIWEVWNRYDNRIFWTGKGRENKIEKTSNRSDSII